LSGIGIDTTYGGWVSATGPDLTGLVGWYKADAGVTAVSNAISAIADQSSNANNLSGTGTLVPGGLNGLAYVQLNGSSNTLTKSAANMGTNAALSIFAVARINSTTTNAWFVDYETGQTNGAFLWSSPGSAGKPIFQDYATAGAASSGTLATSWSRITGIAGTTTIGIGVAGGTLVTAANVYSGTNGKNLSIGSQAGTGFFGQWDFAEILIYNADKTTQRTAIETYLTSRWGV